MSPVVVRNVLILAAALLLALVAVSACDTTHIIEVCVPLDSISTNDTLVVFHKTACR